MKRLARPPRLKARPLDTHKARVGRVLVVGGSAHMCGAPALSGLGALRAGAGLVKVAVPSSIQPIVAGYRPELMTHRLPEGAEGALSAKAASAIKALAKDWDCVVLGPGAGRTVETGRTLLALMRELTQPIVIDADALFALGSRPAQLSRRKAAAVLTPHEGEAARLLSTTSEAVREDRTKAAVALAKATRATILLKGPGTIVTDAERLYVNKSGGAMLATGGTGDVLAGVVAAFLAAGDALGVDALEAAAAAAYVHGRAAEQVAGAADRGYLAGDFADALPFAVSELVRGPR